MVLSVTDDEMTWRPADINRRQNDGDAGSSSTVVRILWHWRMYRGWWPNYSNACTLMRFEGDLWTLSSLRNSRIVEIFRIPLKIFAAQFCMKYSWFCVRNIWWRTCRFEICLSSFTIFENILNAYDRFVPFAGDKSTCIYQCFIHTVEHNRRTPVRIILRG